jgi:hypothetical protein
MCEICGASFYPKKENHRACSNACGMILEFGALPYTKEEVTSTLLHMYADIGNAPSTKLVSMKLKYATSRFFGTWNKAMRELGIPINRKCPRKRIPCKDGHIAESVSEKLIDEWLLEHHIKHERSWHYPEGRYTCDFYLPDTKLWVEYFGFLDSPNSSYVDTIVKKRAQAQKYGFQLLEIYPENLYPENELSELFSFRV